jgi:hypothetical protein
MDSKRWKTVERQQGHVLAARIFSMLNPKFRKSVNVELGCYRMHLPSPINLPPHSLLFITIHGYIVSRT